MEVLKFSTPRNYVNLAQLMTLPSLRKMVVTYQQHLLECKRKTRLP